MPNPEEQKVLNLGIIFFEKTNKLKQDQNFPTFVLLVYFCFQLGLKAYFYIKICYQSQLLYKQQHLSLCYKLTSCTSLKKKQTTKTPQKQSFLQSFLFRETFGIAQKWEKKGFQTLTSERVPFWYIKQMSNENENDCCQVELCNLVTVFFFLNIWSL